MKNEIITGLFIAAFSASLLIPSETTDSTYSAVARLKAEGYTLKEIIAELSAATDSECEEIEHFYNLNK